MLHYIFSTKTRNKSTKPRPRPTPKAETDTKTDLTTGFEGQQPNSTTQSSKNVTVQCRSFVRDFVLRSVHVTNPAYLAYCRDLTGAMVCIKPPEGTQAGGGSGSLLEQVRGGGGGRGWLSLCVARALCSKHGRELAGAILAVVTVCADEPER